MGVCKCEFVISETEYLQVLVTASSYGLAFVTMMTLMLKCNCCFGAFLWYFEEHSSVEEFSCTALDDISLWVLV